MGVSRSAERVARSSTVSAFPASRFAWVRLSGSVVVKASSPLGSTIESRQRIKNGLFVLQGRKAVPSAVPPSFGDAALVTDGPLSLPIGAAR